MNPDKKIATNPMPPANPAPEAAQPQDLPLPTVWPGAFKAYKFSKQAVKLNANAIVGWSIISGLISIVLSFMRNLTHLNAQSKFFIYLIGYIVAPLFTAIITRALISGVRQQPVGFIQALSEGSHYWVKIFFLNILVFLSLTASIILLIVPFFFVWPRLTLANYFLVDKNMGIIEAYKASWNATKGNVDFIYGILGAQIAMGLLAITIIGIPFSIYYLIMYSAAHALLYEIIIKQPAPASTLPAALVS